MSKLLYFDSFVYSHIAKDGAFADQIRKEIQRNSYTLVCSVTNLIEIFPNRRRWDEIIEFISSVPFAIAGNPDQLVDHEVQSYPSGTEIPLLFVSNNHSFSDGEIRQALLDNLVGKIQTFRTGFVSATQGTLTSLIGKRDSKLIAFTKPEEADLFLMTSVMSMLYGSHPNFVTTQIAAGNEIRIEHFKTYYIQALLIFEEYYQQKKQGKPSDVGDIFQNRICTIRRSSDFRQRQD